MKIYHNEKDEAEASKEGPSYFLETKRKISIKSDIQSPNLSICFFLKMYLCVVRCPGDQVEREPEI